MAKRFKFFVVLAAFCLLGSTALMAQVASTGRLIGTVTDQTGAVIAGAKITIRDNDTGAVIETQSSGEGHFGVASLKPGTYTVEVTMTGFKKAEFRAVKVTVDQTYDLTAKLEVGALEATVVVEAGAEVLETAKPTVGTSIVGKSITQLPFTARDALDLALLMPGAAATGRPRETSFMGLPKGAINITYDGINAQDNILKSSDGFFTTIRPRIDAVDEFTISTAAAGADASGEGAVQINFTTKRGGNEFHGGVWWYHRNDFLNANYYFNNEVAPGQKATPRQRMRLNQYGWKVGGPVWKDRVFFFVAWDNYKKPDSFTRQRTILTDEATGGVYRYNTVSSYCAGGAAGGCPPPPAIQNPPLQSWMNCGGAFTPGFVGTVPAGTSCAATLLGTPGSLAATAGTTNVPDTLMLGYLTTINSSTAAPGVSLPSAPSPWQRTLQFNNKAFQRRYFPDVRLDWNISKNHQLTGIYHLGKFYSTPDGLNGRDPTYPVAPFSTLLASQNSIRHEAVTFWRWNIGSNKSNELRFGIVTAPIWFFNDQQTGIYPVVTHNLGSIFVRPSFFGVSNPFLAYDPVNGGPQPRNTALGQLIETFSWSKGKHNLTFGGSVTALHGGINNLFFKGGSLTLGMSQFDPANATFTTPANFPGGNAQTDPGNAAGLYAMLAGRITGYSASVPLDFKTRQFVTGGNLLEKYRQNEFGFYGTDTWRIFTTLTLSFGLRWEFQPSPYDTNGIYFEADGGKAAGYGISGLNNLFQPGTLTGAVTSYHSKGSGQWYNTDMKELAPSLGLAWQPSMGNKLWKAVFGEAGKTVFRAGYAVNFTREGTNNFLGVSETNPGYTGSQVANASSTAGPGAFVAGSLQFQNLTVTNVSQNPAVFTATGFVPDPNTAPQTAVYNPNIRIPLVHSWSVGIQREINPNMVVEIRYVGNHGSGLWRLYNLNETNIFENQFLPEFGLAQNNLRICQANSAACIAAQAAAGVSGANPNNRTSSSFADWGLAGQVPLSIFTTAFTGVNTLAGLTAASGPPAAGACAPFQASRSTAPNQCNSNFGTFITQFGLTNLTPAPGAIASSIGGSLAFMCNLAGFSVMNAGVTGLTTPAGACPTTAQPVGLYPINFFRVNPQSRGGSFLMANDAHSSYNSLTVEFRRRMARGIQFSANYTFSKALTNLFGNSSLNNVSFSTLRDFRRDRGPSPWDLRHQFKFNGIWELPFGPGKRWNSGYGWFNRVIEGWEISATNRWQTGRVFRLDGGIAGSFNQNDAGVELIGITPNQIQNSLSIRKLPDSTVWWFPESLISCNAARTSCTGNFSVIRACRVTGQPSACQRLFLYGPPFFRFDMNVVKRTRITERVNFEFRAEFLNAFNNINFFFPGSETTTVASTGSLSSTNPLNSLQGNGFGRVTNSYRDLSTTDDPGGRIIQVVLRVNF